NPRLHVELFLIRLSRLNSAATEVTEKKKPDIIQKEEEIPYPSKSGIIRETTEHTEAFRIKETEHPGGKHAPVIERNTRSFSIKDIISEEKKDNANVNDQVVEKAREEKQEESVQVPGEELTAESFDRAWKEFTDSLKGEGTRIVSMFKTVKTEINEDAG